jgi:hypothetical protein
MQTKYIPCQKDFLIFSAANTNTAGYCTPITRFPIEKIKLNKKYLSFANPVSEEDINYIVSDFYLYAWEPIFLNPKKYLIDGQYRLAAAKKMGLKFMDVIIIYENVNQNAQ